MIEFTDVRDGQVYEVDVSTKRSILKFLIQHDFLKDILNYKVAYEQVIHYHDMLFYDDLKYYKYIVQSLDNQLSNDGFFVDSVKLFDSYFYNKYRQIKRVKLFIENVIMSRIDLLYNAYFVTLTLRDTYTYDEITSDQYSRVRRQVRDFVKSFSDYYVLNKDYGVDDNYTKRLHFHGVVLLHKANVESFIESYNDEFGFCKVDLIDDHSDYISKYINKLTYHALKVNTGSKRECLIFSRRQL